MGDIGELGEVKLDIKALTEYSGQGMCIEIMCNGRFMLSYREELETWAKGHDWTLFEFNCFPEPFVMITKLMRMP